MCLTLPTAVTDWCIAPFLKDSTHLDHFNGTNRIPDDTPGRTEVVSSNHMLSLRFVGNEAIGVLFARPSIDVVNFA